MPRATLTRWLFAFLAHVTSTDTTPAGFIQARYQRRLQRLHKRTTSAWLDYLAECRGASPDSYEHTERHAWSRLLGRLAEIKNDQRGYDLDRDRALTDLLEVTKP